MRIGVIDNSNTTVNYLKTKHKTLGDIDSVQVNPNNSLDFVSNLIIDNSYSALFINLEISIAESKKSDFKGIDLIHWLRLKYNFDKPIITYSFLSADQLIKHNLKNVIINAPKSFHWSLYGKLPIDFIKNKILTSTTTKKDYINYAKVALDTNQIRHEDANWWGIKVCFDISHYVINEEIGEPKYPDWINKKLEKSNNLLANYILNKDFAQKESKILSEYFLAKNEIKEIVHNKKNDVERLREKRDILKEENEVISQIATEAKEQKKNVELDISSISEFENQEESIQQLNNKISTIEAEIANLESKIKKNISDIQLLNFNVNTESIKLEQIKNELKLYKNDTKKLRKENIQSVQPKHILIIDDHDLDGWNEAYQLILGSSYNLHSFQKGNSEFNTKNVLQYIKSSFNKTTNQFLNGILLDLRLTTADQSESNFKNLTGVKILKNLKLNYPKIPIIICTASNKYWTLESVIAEGADAFWVKEGIDNNFSHSDSINNYYKLRNLVFNLTHKFEAYQRLESLERKIERETTPFWWQANHFFSFPNINPSNQNEIDGTISFSKEELVKIIKDAKTICKSYLRLKYLNNNLENDYPYVLGIILQLFTFIEQVHPPQNKNLSVGTLANARGDKTARYIASIRNRIAHNLQIDDLEIFLINFIKSFSGYVLYTPKLKDVDDKVEVAKSDNFTPRTIEKSPKSGLKKSKEDISESVKETEETSVEKGENRLASIVKWLKKILKL